MKYLVLVGRIIFGGWFIYAGLNHWFAFTPQPYGEHAISIQFTTALVESGLFDLVKAVEAITGLLILIGVFTPLALVVVAPVSVCVGYFNLVLEHNGIVNYMAGWLVLGINAWLLFAYLDSYRPLLRWNEPARWA